MSEDQEYYGAEDDQEQDDGMPQSFMHQVALDTWRYDRGNWERVEIPSVTLTVSFDDEDDTRDHLETAIEALGYERIGGSEPGNELGQIQLFAREADAEPIANAEFAVSVVLGERNDVVFATDLPSLLMLVRELEPLGRAKLHAAAWVQ